MAFLAAGFYAYFAYEQVTATQTNLIITERPYVTVEQLTLTPFRAGHPTKAEVAVKYANRGKTPAREMHMWGKAFIAKPDETTSVPIDAMSETAEDLGPDGIGYSAIYSDTIITDEQQTAVDLRQARLIAYGALLYDNDFGEHGCEGFCYMFDPKSETAFPSGFIQCPTTIAGFQSYPCEAAKAAQTKASEQRKQQQK